MTTVTPKCGDFANGLLTTAVYPYMPRLRNRRELDEGIVDMPLIWQTDAFALATGYDESAGRYIGLWTPEDKGTAPAATNSVLLVRPDIAAKRREAELPATAGTPSSPGEKEGAEHTEPDSEDPGALHRNLKTGSSASRRSTPRKLRWTSRTSPTRSSPT